MYEYYCSFFDMMGFISFLFLLVQMFFTIIGFIAAYRLDKKVKLWRFLLIGTSLIGWVIWIYLFIRDKGRGNNGIQKFLIDDTSY